MTTLFIGLLMILVGIANNRLKLYKLDIFYFLTKNDKKQVEREEAKARAIEKSFVLCGSLMIIANLLIRHFGLQDLEIYVFWIIFLVTFILSIYFDISNSGIFRNVKIVIVSITVIFVTALFSASYASPKLALSDVSLTCGGLYGFDVKLQDIDSIAITEILPDIRYRSNGSSFMGVHKGYFQTKKYGEIKLQLKKECKKYIFIKKKDGDVLFVNNGDLEATQELFDIIKNKKL